MSQNVTETMFNSKVNLHDFFPTQPYTRYFDIEKKHLLYGRIDRDGDAVILDGTAHIKEIYSGPRKTNFALDFVCDAFNDMRLNTMRLGNTLDRNGLYGIKLQVFKSLKAGVLEDQYQNHINRLYTNFVDQYLTIDHRQEKIKNYEDFVTEFVRYAIRIADQFPTTRTGYILSRHCSPYCSGLMIDIASESYGVDNNARTLDYIADANFDFIVKQAKKFGFMIDKNSPWRLVFNIFSGVKNTQNESGAKLYMSRRGVNANNVFNFYFNKAHLSELVSLRSTLHSLYDAFYTQYSTYIAFESKFCNRKVIRERKDREPPPDMSVLDNKTYEYWLKILLKLRLTEAQVSHDDQNFPFIYRQVIDQFRTFGPDAAMNQINNLTKGIAGTIFNVEGAYWHGQTPTEYTRRKAETKKNIHNPNKVDYSITGAKNSGS